MSVLPSRGLTGWYWRDGHGAEKVAAVTFVLSYTGTWIAWTVGLLELPWYDCFMVGLWPWIICNLLLTVYNVSKL